MFDLLAAISSVDPPALLAWLVLAFAAGMYPVGIMLGSSCSPCCGPPCSQCAAGALPDTLTVTFDDLPEQTQGPELCSLTFSSAYGSGAAGKATAPGGDREDDKGPISALGLTSGGSGYAKLGRVAPAITASGGSGTGATFSVSTTSANDANGIPSWSVTGVTVTGTTTDYVDGDQITFSVAAGDTEDQAAAATINTARAAPTLSASVTSDAGAGATLSVTLTQTTDYDGRAVWNASGITATSGGSDYVVGDPVSVTVIDGQETYYSYFSASVSSVDGGGAITGITIDYGGEYFKDDGVTTSVTVDAGGTYYRADASASPYVATVAVGVSQTPPSDGTGAVLTATVEEDTASANFGKITGVTIANGGSDYLAWEWKNTKCCGWYWDGKPVVVERASLLHQFPCELTFASCYGSGAAGRVTAPDPTIWEPGGPLEAVAVTSGGSGYARLARVSPAITASAPSGTGAVFSITLSESSDACGLPLWSISGMTVTSGGIGYTHGSALTFSAGTGGVTQQAAAGTILISTSSPTLTATPSGAGGGASLSVNVAAIGTTPETWRISTIAVTSGGSGYIDSKSVTIGKASGDVVVTAASAKIRTGRLAPTLAASLPNSLAGSGAVLTPILTAPFADTDGRTVWGVSGFTIVNPGTGYAASDFILITPTDGQQIFSVAGYFARVSAVEVDGGIREITVVRQGKFFKDSGIIEVVEVTNTGAFYRDNGIASVNLTSAGVYYKQDASLTPYVADVVVGFEDTCQGSEGSVTAVIETNTSSANFGKIVSVAITAAGDGYVAGPGRTAGRPDSRRSDAPCVYTHLMCGGWQTNGRPGSVFVEYRGASLPPRVTLDTEGWQFTSSDQPFANNCDATFIADGTLGDCSNWSGLSFRRTLSDGTIVPGTATVTAGGTYDVTYKRKTTMRSPAGASGTYAGICDNCCQGEEDFAEEITASLEHNRYGDTSLSGDYVLHKTVGAAWAYSNDPLYLSVQILPGPCAAGDTPDCDGCIKKCAIFANLSGIYAGDRDMRECPDYDSSLTEEERSVAKCAAYCIDTPVCSPSGATFNFFDLSGAQPEQNACDPNTDPGYPNHLNTFVMTIE